MSTPSNNPGSLAAGQVVQFEFNRPQAEAFAVMANEMYAFAGRGSGKTTGIIAPWILHKVEAMPRSNGGLVGRSFTDLETKILQPLFLAFQMFGLEKDEHYVYGKRPPETWEKPLTPIIDHSTVLTFPNGTTVELISLHLTGSANAKSLQWCVFDEAKLLDEVQLRAEVFPILRGHVNHFGNSPWYGAKLFVTDKLSPRLHWLLDKRKLVDKDAAQCILFYQLKVNELRLKLADTDSLTRKEVDAIRKEIALKCKVIDALRKDLVYVVEASAKDNIKNLSPSYFDNMKRSLTPYEYSVAIDNEDPTRSETTFYPDRSEIHLHKVEQDDDYSQPLGVVFDYQASISPLVVFQVNDKVTGFRTLNFIDCLYVKYPLGLKDVVGNFCDKYANRPNKTVRYYFDHTAVARRAGQLCLYEEIEQYFVANGWTVESVYMGQAPFQDVKFRRIKHYLSNIEADPLQIRIHEHRCVVMVLAMDQTETKETEKGTGKDKSKERDQTFPQEQATHFPDCFDQAVWAVCELGLWKDSGNAVVGINGLR